MNTKFNQIKIGILSNLTFFYYLFISLIYFRWELEQEKFKDLEEKFTTSKEEISACRNKLLDSQHEKGIISSWEFKQDPISLSCKEKLNEDFIEACNQINEYRETLENQSEYIEELEKVWLFTNETKKCNIDSNIF